MNRKSALPGMQNMPPAKETFCARVTALHSIELRLIEVGHEYGWAYVGVFDKDCCKKVVNCYFLRIGRDHPGGGNSYKQDSMSDATEIQLRKRTVAPLITNKQRKKRHIFVMSCIMGDVNTGEFRPEFLPALPLILGLDYEDKTIVHEIRTSQRGLITSLQANKIALRFEFFAHSRTDGPS
jgi:hypothetical protein